MILSLWSEVRGGQELLGFGVRWEEPHIWVVTAVKDLDLPQLTPPVFLAVTYFGIETGWIGTKRGHFQPKAFYAFLCSQHRNSEAPEPCPLGWSCPICDRWCRTKFPEFPFCQNTLDVMPQLILLLPVPHPSIPALLQTPELWSELFSPSFLLSFTKANIPLNGWAR